VTRRDVQFLQGSYYHVYNRGAGHQAIFRESDNYLFVLRRIKEYAQQFRIAIVAYCLMPNHYHLLVRQDGEQSAGLLPQRIFNSYTKAFNKRYDRTGTLLEGRFEAILVDDTKYLLHLCRYIHMNPVKHGLSACPDDWPYSNYHEWTGQREGTLIDHAFVRGYFPLAADYIRFVDEYRPAALHKLERYLLEE
jgi:REP element-mobilizing transposase RayT